MIDETQDETGNTATETPVDAGLPEFDFGDGYASTEAKDAGDFPVLPASKRKTTRDAQGQKHTEYLTRYLVELAKPAGIVTPNFPGAKARFKAYFRSVNFIPGTRVRGTVFFEFPPILTDEQIVESIDSDIAAAAPYTRKPGFERETAIERRKSMQQRSKSAMESLRVTLGGQDPRVLCNTGMVGVKFAVAVSTREQNNGETIAEAVKFFPGVEANG